MKRSWIKRGDSVLKRSPLRQKSFKKYLKEEVGKAQLEYLRLFRHNEHICDICKKYRPFLSRFHILPVSKYSKMEFVDENVLLTDWLPCHEKWHHDYEEAKHIEARIMEIRGLHYKEKLITMNALQPKQTEMILSCRLHHYRTEILNLTKSNKNRNIYYQEKEII